MDDNKLNSIPGDADENNDVVEPVTEDVAEGTADTEETA